MNKNIKKVSEKEKLVKSINKNIRSSTRKLKPILKSIVGKKVDIAIRDLTFSDKRISKDIKKTISSAVANAENNFQYDIDKLVVKEAYCGKQIVMKRFRPRAKGRAAPILKSIVGKNVDNVIKDLTFSDKRISKDIKKTISSAVSNAENNFQYDIDNLFVKEAYCGKQMVMKRFRPRAKGRASPIIKPYSNLTIILAEKQKEKVEKR